MSTVEYEVKIQAESPAGKALAPFGFKPAHQGGGIVNFERPDGHGGREHVVTEDGRGPLALEEPVEVVTDSGVEAPYESLSDLLRALSGDDLS